MDAGKGALGNSGFFGALPGESQLKLGVTSSPRPDISTDGRVSETLLQRYSEIVSGQSAGLVIDGPMVCNIGRYSRYAATNSPAGLGRMGQSR